MSTRHINEEIKKIIQGTPSYELEKYFDELIEENERLHTENERYRKALEFYADEETYTTNATDQWEPVVKVMKDEGKTAFEALENTKGSVE